jgi:hypothetical protein
MKCAERAHVDNEKKKKIKITQREAFASQNPTQVCFRPNNISAQICHIVTRFNFRFFLITLHTNYVALFRNWNRRRKLLLPHIRNDQKYELTVPLLYSMYWLPTCFGSSLPSSGSFLDPSELLEIQIKWVLYHIMCGYVATCHVTTHYMTYHLFDLYFK